MAEQLLHFGANTEDRDNDGWTPLIYASRYGHQRGVGRLLNFGANPIAKDDDGWTAITYAIQNGHENILEQILINAGAKQ